MKIILEVIEFPFFFKKKLNLFLPLQSSSLTMLYILDNKLVKTFDRNPGFSVVAFILFVTKFLTRALQTVCRLSVTRLTVSILKIKLSKTAKSKFLSVPGHIIF